MLPFCASGTTFRSSSSPVADKVVKEPRVRGPHRLSSTQFSEEVLLELSLPINETR